MFWHELLHAYFLQFRNIKFAAIPQNPTKTSEKNLYGAKFNQN